MFGSALAQISLILGFIALINGAIPAKNILLLGAAALSVGIAMFAILDGELTQNNGAIIVESVARISVLAGMPEYFISFFVIGPGTSLPELSVELAAARKKQSGLLLGDMMYGR